MKTANRIIESMGTNDWESVRDINQEGIATGNTTVEAHAPAWERWNSVHRPDCRLVARDGERVVGWAALSPVSDREAYSGVAEVSVYVADGSRGMGGEKLLLNSLVSTAEAAGVRTLQASIFMGNAASIALHFACGFRTVGARERIWRLNGRWRDTLFMERRSDVAGA